MKNSIFTVLAALVLYPAGAQPVTPQDRRRAAGTGGTARSVLPPAAGARPIAL